ncbi:unnamed protein product, partial [Brassica rapa subsp. narinosa]
MECNADHHRLLLSTKLNTRFRNILGYSIYTAGTFCLIIVSTLNFQQNV